jgi:hypothetical protein
MEHLAGLDCRYLWLGQGLECPGHGVLSKCGRWSRLHIDHMHLAFEFVLLTSLTTLM